MSEERTETSTYSILNTSSLLQRISAELHSQDYSIIRIGSSECPPIGGEATGFPPNGREAGSA